MAIEFPVIFLNLRTSNLPRVEVLVIDGAIIPRPVVHTDTDPFRAGPMGLTIIRTSLNNRKKGEKGETQKGLRDEHFVLSSLLDSCLRIEKIQKMAKNILVKESDVLERFGI